MIKVINTFPQKVDVGHTFIFSIFFVEHGGVTINIYSVGGIAIVNLAFVAVSQCIRYIPAVAVSYVIFVSFGNVLHIMVGVVGKNQGPGRFAQT